MQSRFKLSFDFTFLNIEDGLMCPRVKEIRKEAVKNYCLKKYFPHKFLFIGV